MSVWRTRQRLKKGKKGKAPRRLIVWIVMDDGPEEWAPFFRLRAYQTREGAKRYLERCQRRDSYGAQYLKVFTVHVRKG
jgi:hypothetical protein